MKEKKDLDIQIGKRIKEARKKAGYTQDKLSDYVGVSVQYISDLERGVVGTSIPTLIKICETLQASADYILMGRGEPLNLSESYQRLQYLPPEKKELVDRGINLLMEAITYK